jgi:uncharacterized protein YoxC
MKLKTAAKSGIGLTSTINQLNRLNETLSNMTISSGKIAELVSSLKPLSEIEKSNLGSMLNQLKKIPEITEKLDSAKIAEFAIKIQQVTAAIRPLAAEMEKVSAGFSRLPANIQRAINANAKLTASNSKLGGSFASIKLTAFLTNLRYAYSMVRGVATVIAGWIGESNDYVENLNLFTVAMGEYAASAQEYAEQVSAALGIDPSEWMRNQGIFNTLLTGFGNASSDAALMSKNLTQLGYDLSSFFNISFEDSMQKLQSGVSGELEPLRRLGYDLSQAKLQAIALSLGIDQSVSSMTQAEKSLLRYYAIMTQVTTAQGDMARTLIAPANQLRILSAQATQAARALGNIFIPALNLVLPYAIAFLKVIRSVANEIANLFGFTLPEIDYSGLSTMTSGASDLSDSMDDAASSANNLKKAVFGFDELNVINNDTSSGSGSPSGTSGLGGSLGIDLPEYDFLGDLVSQKSDEIAAKMGGTFKAILIGAGVLGLVGIVSKIIIAVKGLFGASGISKSSAFMIPSPRQVLTGLLDLAIIIGGVVVLIEAIGLLMKIPGFESTAVNGVKAIGIVFGGIADIALPLAEMSLGIIVLGKIGISNVLSGLVGLAAIMAEITVLITLIGAFVSIPYFSGFLSTGIESLKKIFNGLWEIAIPLGVFTAGIIILGFVTPGVVVSGLLGFGTIVAGLAVLLVALGALNQIPGFDWIVGEGGEVLISLGDILGRFAGSIVGGALAETSKAMPEIGTNLALFATNAQPFFTQVGTVDAGTMEAIKNLAAAIMLLTAADVMAGLTSWITGGSSFVQFGKDLNEFAPYFVAYSHMVKGVDANAVNNSATAAKSLAEFANNVPKSGGLAAWFAGENDIDVWGAKLPMFGRNFKAYSDNIQGVNGDAVVASATAAKSIAEFADNIPNQGGVKAWFGGDNDIDKWGAKLPAFGKNLKDYSNNINGINPDVITATSIAAKSIAELAANIPNEGGVKAWFGGDNGIDVWGSKLPAFGKNFKSYYNTIKDIDTSKVTGVTATMNELVDFATRVKDSVDTGAIDKFTAAIKALGESITKLPTIKNIGLSITWDYNINSTQKTLSNMLGFPGWPKLKAYAYANGGFPDQGELFIANEAGPEMVGSMGGKTTVANNNQIIEGIASGVQRANSEQNELLRQQNSLLTQLVRKNGSIIIGQKEFGEAARDGLNYLTFTGGDNGLVMGGI